jgi:drug/metabolite transporter (DMT)-like permease
VIHALGHWQPYVLVVFGVGGMVLGQSAFQAGALDVSLPTMSVADPVVSILIGALVFEETISDATASVFLEVVGLIVMSVGIVLLARGEVAGTVRESPPQPTA